MARVSRYIHDFEVRSITLFGTEMKTTLKEDGILVRVELTGDTLALVLEPIDEGFALELASRVTVVELTCVKPTTVRMTDIERNTSEPVWLTWDGGMVTFESEHAPTFAFSCASATAVQRDYDAQDLRAKFQYLSRRFRAGEEANGKVMARLTKTKEALAKFIDSHRHTWTLKREFFAGTTPDKAKDFAVRLEVLDEIDKIMKED